MKIKTITCHEVYNYGASLQEYALLRYLENLGHEAETIHYKPPYLSKHFKLWIVSNEFFNKNIILRGIYLILKLPKRLINLKRKRKFDEFSIKYIKTGNRLYRSNEELKDNVPEADAYICGSDQIWNSFFENGKDATFYLDFVPNDKLKLSYAASFAIDELEDDIKGFVKEKVSNLDHISVRESSGKRILENLGFDKVTQVLDPVFLLDPKEWTRLMLPQVEEDIINKGKFIIVYDFDNDPVIKELAERLKKEKGWKIYAFNEMIDYADKNFYLDGPEVFLSILNNAECILANSFHAVAYSLILHKNIAVFNRSDKINTRMRDLLQSVELNNFLLNKDTISDYKLDIIDYKQVQDKLDVLIEKSKKYLDTALEN
ncbi:polysaccharide pyruvyl transferase family protein [Aquimarina sp. I32.4]|uniref:polysaccharide pyruvyl transferase family protein n=1 Tax=Aquimarina sp. I32.4 TaxID=2053903 RepID=UPI000CDE64A6|nr:polysaccharide pyruvyl transferase family protein [Aquimarina sp. I32.4]